MVGRSSKCVSCGGVVVSTSQMKIRRLSLTKGRDATLCSCSAPAGSSDGKGPVKLLQNVLVKPAETPCEAKDQQVEDCNILRRLLTKSPVLSKRFSAKKRGSRSKSVVTPPTSSCVELPTPVDGVAVSPKRIKLTSPSCPENFDTGAELERIVRELGIDVISQESAGMLPPPPPAPVEVEVPASTSDGGKASPPSNVGALLTLATTTSGECNNVEEAVECVSSTDHTLPASDNVAEDAVVSLTQQNQIKEDDGVRRVAELFAEVQVARNVRDGFQEQLQHVKAQRTAVRQKLASLECSGVHSPSWVALSELERRDSALSLRVANLMQAMHEKSRLIVELTSRIQK